VSSILTRLRHITCIDSVQVFLVRRAWRFIWGCKSPARVGNDQVQAKGKGVHREVESEGSRRHKSGLSNTNRIRHIEVGETAKQVKPKSYPEPRV